MAQTPIQIVNEFPRVVIAGVGLLGGSIGLALKQAGYTGQILGIGRRESSLQKAMEAGCIDQSILTTDAACWSFPGPAVVVLATPICTFESHFQAIAATGRDDLVITDAGSTKQVVCQFAADHLPDPGWFVGAHPMAGSEKQGPEHAKAELLHGRPAILTPCAQTHKRAMDVVAALWHAIGMRTLTMTPDEHDRTVAAISHLPHAAAMLLVLNAARQAQALDIAAGGFRDTTRVASGDVAVWRDIFMTNREALVQAIDFLRDDLGALRDQLAAGNAGFVLDQLAQAKAVRDQWIASPGRGASLPAGPME